MGELLPEFEHDPRFWAEMWLGGIAEDLSRRMNEQSLNRAQLAIAAGVRPAAITKLLRSQADATALTIAKLAVALGQVPRAIEWQSLQGRLAEVRGYSASGQAPTLPDLKGRLLATIEKHLHVHPLDDGTSAEVVTPFFDHRNDGISYYVEATSDGHHLLHDNGQALNSLEMSGVELEAAMSHVRRVLNRTGVELVGRRLELSTASLGLGMAQLRFVQCLQSVDSLTVLAFSRHADQV